MESAAYKAPRVAFYFVTFALAVVGIAASVNALVSVQRDGQKLKDAESVIPGLDIRIDVGEVYTAGGVLAFGEFMTFNSAVGSLLMLFFPRKTERAWVQWVSIVGWVAALLVIIPSASATLAYSLTSKARVTAYINGSEIPPSLLDEILKLAGPVNLGVWQFDYIKFFAVTPWPLIAFALVSTALTIAARLKTRSASAINVHSGSSPASHASGADGSRERLEKEPVEDLGASGRV